MMKYLSFLRKHFWASFAIITGYALAMNGPSPGIKIWPSESGTGADGLFGLSYQFPRPAGLDDAVNFWRQVFAEWRAHQLVLHDDTYLGVVYDTVEITGYIGGRLSAEQQATVDQQKKYLAFQLDDMNYRLRKHIALTSQQRQYHALLINKAGPKALRDAADRIRVQRGMKESFQIGLKASNRYDTLMRQVFAENHLPEALVHLPHVESAFTTTARSPAGAVGVWQFMPVTGKRYLRIDKAMDERYDPILATQGAARYLAYAYERLGDWGLAITSYNHGLPGMLRARKEHGQDLVRIIHHYDGASFGFASRNYYAEFLAVCDIMANLPAYFPNGIDYLPPAPVKRVELAQAMTSGEIAKKYRVNYRKLAELNPAWTKEAAEGRVALPANIAVWLPNGSGSTDSVALASNENSKKDRIALALTTQPNPTNKTGNDALQYLHAGLPSIALLSKFPDGISGQLVADASQMTAAKILPVKASAKRKRVNPNLAHEIHIVKSGDSPYTIASKYAVQLRELLALNEMQAGAMIRPGQPILIPQKINS